MSKTVIIVSGTSAMGTGEGAGSVNDVMARIRSRAWELFENQDIESALDEYSDETHILRTLEWYENDRCMLLCADDDVAEICAREVGGVVQSRVGVPSTVLRLSGYRWDQGELAPGCEGLFAELDRSIAEVRESWPDCEPVFHAGVGHLGMVMLIGLYASTRGLPVLGLCSVSDHPMVLPSLPHAEMVRAVRIKREEELDSSIPLAEQKTSQTSDSACLDLEEKLSRLNDDLTSQQNEAFDLRNQLQEKKALEVVLSVAHESLNQQITMLQVKNDTLQGQLSQYAERATVAEEELKEFRRKMPRLIHLPFKTRLEVLFKGDVKVPLPKGF
ncbi:MAG: hypothetical protein PHF70_11515 [Opitutales bacterium]|nr:hypothetical protein [Opitutales bacterium]